MAKAGRYTTVIVVVDDDVDLREVICDALAADGYTVTPARNGAEALSTLRQANDVCLVLLDLMMPVMSGYEFLKVRSSDPQLAKIPVVVMSARWEGSDETGVVEFLRKPPGLAVILETVARYCSPDRTSILNR